MELPCFCGEVFCCIHIALRNDPPKYFLSLGLPSISASKCPPWYGPLCGLGGFVSVFPPSFR